MEPSSLADPSLETLRGAIRSNDPAAIRAALPEPPAFLSIVFRLPPEERDVVLAGVLSALDTDEDIWEIFEAAAMNDTVRPESRALIVVAPYLRSDQLADALELARRIPDASASGEAQLIIQARAEASNLTIDN